MEEGGTGKSTSNGGMLYHEAQEGKLCAVHCLNAVLQGPFFSAADLAAIASVIDSQEGQVGVSLPDPSHNVLLPDDSHNVSLGGDFSIQVLHKALEVWDLVTIPMDSPEAEPARKDPDDENAFVCHHEDHWFCIRKVNGEWYNFDSLFPAPEPLSRFYLAACLDSLKSSGWSIFIVRGNFPKEFPISSDSSSNGYGTWLSPEDAETITKSCRSSSEVPQIISSKMRELPDPLFTISSAEEEEDLQAAIAASLVDVSQSMTNAKRVTHRTRTRTMTMRKLTSDINIL